MRPDVWPAHPALLRIVIGGFWDDELDESPFITIELAATGAEAAEHLAQELVSHMLVEAGLPTSIRPVVWVAPLSDDSVSSHRFLEQAKELFNSEQFELAIVAAHMHFELQLRLLLKRAADRAGGKWARRLIKNRRAAMLGNDVSIATAELLLGVDVTQVSLWPEFSAHMSRRNVVVHEGRAVGSNEAAASIRVVQELGPCSQRQSAHRRCSSRKRLSRNAAAES